MSLTVEARCCFPAPDPPPAKVRREVGRVVSGRGLQVELQVLRPLLGLLLTRGAPADADEALRWVAGLAWGVGSVSTRRQNAGTMAQCRVGTQAGGSTTRGEPDAAWQAWMYRTRGLSAKHKGLDILQCRPSPILPCRCCEMLNLDADMLAAQAAAGTGPWPGEVPSGSLQGPATRGSAWGGGAGGGPPLAGPSVKVGPATLHNEEHLKRVAGIGPGGPMGQGPAFRGGALNSSMTLAGPPGTPLVGSDGAAGGPPGRAGGSYGGGWGGAGPGARAEQLPGAVPMLQMAGGCARACGVVHTDRRTWCAVKVH